MISANDFLGSAANPFAKPRNEFFDRCFYDMKALLPSERVQLSQAHDQEGTVIVVSPTKAARTIRLYENATRMLHSERDTIGGVAVAGLGSTIVGTAALARNVADAYGFDVAGIVSGYGMSDLFAEAMGGWFFYGYLDKFRHHLAILVEKTAQLIPAFAAVNTSGAASGIQKRRREHRDRTIPRQLDSGTLLDILAAHPENLRILVGHSKGAMLLDYVLEQFVRRVGRAHRYYEELHVVTVGVAVALPEEFRRKAQIIGGLDWFGGINSLPELLWDSNPQTQPKYIDNALHHLNTEIPFQLPLVDALGTHAVLAPAGSRNS